MIKTGIRGRKSVAVTDENTAAKLRSGMLPVFATPALSALMENTCADSVQAELEEGCGTVGISISCKHLSPSPVGSIVTCESELIEIDRRRLVFSVTAEDDFGPIGEGIHERFIIDSEKFMDKVKSKEAMLRKRSTGPKKD